MAGSAPCGERGRGRGGREVADEIGNAGRRLRRPRAKGVGWQRRGPKLGHLALQGGVHVGIGRDGVVTGLQGR